MLVALPISNSTLAASRALRQTAGRLRATESVFAHAHWQGCQAKSKTLHFAWQIGSGGRIATTRQVASHLIMKTKKGPSALAPGFNW